MIIVIIIQPTVLIMSSMLYYVELQGRAPAYFNLYFIN